MFMLGRRSPVWPCGHTHPEVHGLHGARLGGSGTPPPGVCCQSTSDGGVVCSDGMIYNAG